MSKKTIALIISLFVITVVLIILAVYPVTQKTSVSITPPPTIESQAETVLSFAQPVISTASAISTTSATTYSMDTLISTGTNRVNAVQLELSYNPESLFNVDIEPGDFFTNPVVLLKNIDTEQGRISYALAIAPGQSGKQGTGVVAVLTFRSFVPAGGSTTVSFLPKTQVAAEAIQTSVLKSTIDTTLFRGSSSATLSN